MRRRKRRSNRIDGAARDGWAGPLADKNRVEAHLEIPNLDVHYKQFQLVAAKPIIADYKNGTATLHPTSIRGTGTSIDAQGVVPVTTPKAASFLVKGTVDLGIAQMLVPGITSSGQLQFDIDSKRYGPGANLNGQIKIVNANVHTVDSPVGLDHANGVLNVTQTRLEISNFEGQMEGGTIMPPALWRTGRRSSSIWGSQPTIFECAIRKVCARLLRLTLRLPEPRRHRNLAGR